jgi:hypothetical protein
MFSMVGPLQIVFPPEDVSLSSQLHREEKMTSRRLIFTLSGVLLLVTLQSIPLEAQTVISNETLVSTTFVVSKQETTASCTTFGCRAQASVMKAIPVTCPAAIGQTCTFHISMDAKTAVSFKCGTTGCFGPGPSTFYQFLVDGATPTIGPTDSNGDYLFSKNIYTTSDDGGEGFFASRQAYTVSILAGVTNSNSSSHTIDVNLKCWDANRSGGCRTTSRWTTMRIDVFEP